MPAILLVLFSIFYSLFSIPSVQAACYCQDPSVCRCTTTPPAGAVHEAAIGGVAVSCDTAAEADSIFAIKAPICGSTPEIVPACAPNIANPSELTCYGAEFARGASSVPEEAFSSLTRVDGVTFNGVSYPNARSVLACNSIAFCCARSDIKCDDTQVPSTPSSCPDQSTTTPPASICGVMDVRNNDPGATDSDARIYFPHVRNTSSLTYLLQSMFRPISWTVADIVKNVVVGKVDLHQGVNDNTKVINEINNNSSVIPGDPAPAPLFDFGSTTPQGTVDDGQCLMTNVRSNPGDDLLGNKIYADLEYSQVYEYELLPGVLEGTCRTSGQTASDSGECCSGDGTSLGDDTGRVSCNEANDSLPSKGKVLVYTKSPFLEYLYQNLVMGPAGIYKRFVAQDIGKLIEDNPTKATIAVDSNPGKVTVADGDTQPTSDIYFPHVGSIYDNFLRNLQKLLRPKGGSGNTTFPTVPPDVTLSGGSCTIFSPEKIDATANAAGSKYGVPGSMLKAIYEIEALPYILGRQDYTCDERSAGPEGLMQINLDAYNHVICPGEGNAGVCQDSSPGVLSRCNTTGAFELAARVLLWKNQWWNQESCTAIRGIDASDTVLIYNTANNYYAAAVNAPNCTPDNLTRQYSYNLPSPPRANMNYGDIVCNKMGLCPPYIVPQCSSTPSQYCANNHGGQYRPDSNTCIRCNSDGSVGGVCRR